MTSKELTCVVCPAGCRITVTLDEDGKVLSIDGNTCKRGEKYAESEVTHPVRTLTSTVRIKTPSGIKMLPVKTNKPIPRESLFCAMKKIRAVEVTAPITIGDVICRDYVEEGTNLVSCKTVN